MFAIIGAGDVVHRLLQPALKEANIKNYEIHGTLNDPSELNGVQVHRHEIQDFPKIIENTDLVPWIATPPFHARLSLLEPLACNPRPFIIEKPLGLTMTDVDSLESLSVLDNAFVLSYYVQGKFAPLLWATNKAEVPTRMKKRMHGNLRVPSPLMEVDVVLQEPLHRQQGSVVNTWAVNNMLEFAVHAPSILYNLRFFDLRVLTRSETHIHIKGGGRSEAKITRPAPLARYITAKTTDDTLRIDAESRTVFSSSRGHLSIEPDVPQYFPLLSAVLDWLEGGPAGDTGGQLAALKLLASPPPNKNTVESA